jgi:hypothetical protein
MVGCDTGIYFGSLTLRDMLDAPALLDMSLRLAKTAEQS